MSYEIPQQLEYQEKIIFGLTFKQMFYAIIFLPLALALLFKLKIGLPYRVTLALIPSGLGALFMFTNIPQQLKNILKWLCWKNISDKKMKTFLPLEKIEEDILYLKNKKLSIIKVEPLNFSIRNDAEKQLIISTFQKFLNSLTFPVQIVIATDSLNLDHYLAKLEENTDQNQLYSQIFQDFKKHLQTLISTRGLLNRSFYLVIPERENLLIQVGVCEELLKNMNLRFKRLAKEELMFALSGFLKNLYEYTRLNS